MEPARKRARYDTTAMLQSNTWKLLVATATLIDKIRAAEATAQLTPFYHVLVAIAFNKRQAEAKYAKLADYRNDMSNFHESIVEERLSHIPSTHWYHTILNNYKNANYTAIDNCIYNALQAHYGPVDIDTVLKSI